MHGLTNRAIQNFLAVTYGPAAWAGIAAEAALPEDGFEPLLVYDDDLTDAMLAAAARRLAKPRASLLEDVGTFLVSHPRCERVRRLLRFGGAEFGDFLHSLEDLPARAALAMPTFALPRLALDPDPDAGGGAFRLTCHGGPEGVGHVVLGMMRAMADDYGALALLEHGGTAECCGGGICEVVNVRLLVADYAAARAFELTVGAA